MSSALLGGIEPELAKYGFDEKRWKELLNYSALIPSLTGQRLDRWNGLQLANSMLTALDIAAELTAIATRVKLEIYSERKKQGGLAYLERASTYFAAKEVKATEAGKAEYKEADDTHNNMRMKEAAAEALVEFMRIKTSQIDKAYYLCKDAYGKDEQMKGA